MSLHPIYNKELKFSVHIYRLQLMFIYIFKNRNIFSIDLIKKNKYKKMPRTDVVLQNSC